LYIDEGTLSRTDKFSGVIPIVLLLSFFAYKEAIKEHIIIEWWIEVLLGGGFRESGEDTKDIEGEIS
jgi:hypothetical protein